MATRRRAPAAASVLQGLHKQLEQGWPPGLTVLNGDDLYHLDRAQKALLQDLGRDEATDFALTVYGESKVDVGTVVSAARSVGMFSRRRVVLVSDVTALDGDAEPLQIYAADPPSQSYLIVRAPALDQRRKLHQTLGRAGRLLTFSADRRGAQLDADVKRIATEQGLRIDSRTAGFLAQLTAGDLYRAAGELEKMRAWLGESGTRVTEEIVREVAAGGGLLSGWEVADAVTRRDRPAGLAAARRLVDSGDEPIRIVGGLAWRARVMLQAKAMLDEGARPDEAVRATRSYFFRDALLQGMQRYSLQELLAFPCTLLQADRTLKSRSIHARAVLEHLVDRLTLARAGR